MNILTGLGVSAGEAHGKVRIIEDGGDYESFQEGDILVTELTNPSMVLMMSKAAAIVCDIGGVTSHPSIISREMGIPCVVATKTATKDLKDGDEVLVNGTTGEVKVTPMEEVNNFITSIQTALGDMELGTLKPMDWFEFHPLFSKEWFSHMQRIIDASEGKNLTKLAGTLSGPTQLRVWLYYTLLDMKCAKISKEERERIVRFYHQLQRKTSQRDLWGLAGTNIAHSEEQITSILQNIQFQQGSKELAKTLGRIYSAGFQYINALYTDFYTDYGVEIYGPYDVSKKYGPGHILVIRHFTDLLPNDLWNNVEGLTKKDVKIYTVYKDVKFSCDFISCHSNYEGSVIDNLVEFAVEADNKILTFEEIKSLQEKLELSAMAQWRRLKGLEFEDLKQKGVQIRCYAFKKLCEELNLNWKPSQEMLDAVKDKPFDRSLWNLPEEEDERNEYWRKILDHREEFYP